MNLAEIGGRIKARRKTLGISQEKLDPLSEEQRKRAEDAFSALLPFIR